MLKTRFI